MADTTSEDRQREAMSYEPSDVVSSRIVWIGLALLAALVLVLVALLPYVSHLPVKPPKQPQEAPLLQDPIANARTYREAKTAMLHEYAWVDRDHRIARIPVRRAIEPLLQQQSRRPLHPIERDTEGASP
jgi:hypothetical protein